VRRLAWWLIAFASVLLVGGAGAFVPPPCEDDPTRVIFAGVGDGPCLKFHGDEASCELAYYLVEDDGDGGSTTASCFYVGGTCVGCGGNNLVCPTNTCNGRSNGVATTSCLGDPERTSLLGVGGDGARRCRNLDATDQATCENAFYHEGDDDDDGAVFGNAVACFWESMTGTCRGCGDDGNACPFNSCDPSADSPDAVCTLDSERTNLIGFGGNGSGRCRSLDDTDQAICDSAYYEDADTGLAVACWWDGNDCRGSGFDDFFGWNTCLSPLAPPTPTATCPREPDRMLLGFGHNDTGTCRQLDDTDQATCENAFYEDAEDGVGVACWWDGDDCRGTSDQYRAQNACQIVPSPPSAVCADGRTNLIGFGADEDNTCRQLDDTDEATCENAFYEHEDNGFAVACLWSGDGDCRGCGGRNLGCSENPCIEPSCAGDPTRTNLAGFGSNSRSTGQNGGACRQFGDEATCEISFYVGRHTGRGVACWWDSGICRGSSSSFASEDVCDVGAVCAREPDRTLLGLGGNEQQTCRQHDGDQTNCEDSFYEDDDDGGSVACWWAPGDLCLGSGNRNELLNACQREPVDPAVTCTADPGRQTAIGFAGNRRGNEGGACRIFDGTDAATCEDAFYQDVISHAPVACWWDSDGDDCRGSSSTFSQHNTCDPRQIPCTFDMDRGTHLGTHTDDPCSVFDAIEGGDEAACEDAFYVDVEGAPAAVACWWVGDECEAATGSDAVHNDCFYEDVPTPEFEATCDDRTNHIGFGNSNEGQSGGACRQFDGSDETTCENAFYEVADTGKAVGCWWDGSNCRGSNADFAGENVCPIDVACYLEPNRTTNLGYGNNNSAPCRQFDDDEGGDQAACENAYYVFDDNLTPVACWWDGDECRGSAGDFVENNACVRAPVPPTTCGARSDFLGLGHNNENTCRQLSDTSQSECEDAFYLDEDLLRPTACVWSAGANDCTGTTRWPSLNACDPQTPPSCGGRTLLGKGDRTGVGQGGGACRMFGDETTCENAYYVSRDNEPIGCWWDGADCRGTNKRPRQMENACVPQVGCTDRMTVAGFGGNNQQTCRFFDNTDEATCEDAYYVEPGGHPVACNWNAADSTCLACGRRGGKGTCLVNECAPVECAGDPDRTQQVRGCRDIESVSECEDAWHILGSHQFPPIAASCFWDSDRGECFGCGPPSQGEDQCANVCETGCGNGIVDGGESCDDGNMYDGDCCDSMCQLEADDSPCTDRLFCTVGGGTCQAGVCVGAPPRPCDSCLAADCNESTNSCGDNEESGPGPGVGAVLQGVNAPIDSSPLPPGTECDDGIPGSEAVCNGNGECVDELLVPSATPTSTPTATPTGTPTTIPTITPTPVPVGGACAATAQCVEGAICLEGICTVVAAPAPAASHRGLLAIVMALLAVAAVSMRLRRRPS